jgi:hypothetical protein
MESGWGGARKVFDIAWFHRYEFEGDSRVAK